MKTMYIRYDGWTPSVLGDAVSGQVNTLRCSFAFSADWDEYKNRKAIFETDDAKKEESLDENGVCLIPRAVLMKRGKLKISAYGTETGENGELLRYNGRPAEIIVDLGGNVDGEITDDPVYPQIGEAVLYTAQSLTDAQQAQARANIGAGTPYTLPEASSDALGGVRADAAEETDTQPVRKGTDGKLYTASTGNAVLYTAQSLTDAQQAQARANIGAGTPYTLPEASPDALGGVKADAAEETDTQPVRKGTDGKLYTAPGGDTSIGITGASAGQIPKVKAVDESGAPTEWTAEADTTPFIVKIGGDGSNGYTSSHTFEEIVAAANAGRVVMAYAEYVYIPGVSVSGLYGVYFDLDSTQDVAVFVHIDPWNMIKYTFAVDPFSISASASYLSATSSTFGGIKADAAAETDTQPVRKGTDGKLYTAPVGGGADISLGISGATAGQMAKIKAVNASGAPTAWEAGDAASGESEWRLIRDVTIEEDVTSVYISDDDDGNPFSLKKIACVIYSDGGTGMTSTAYMKCAFNTTSMTENRFLDIKDVFKPYGSHCAFIFVTNFDGPFVYTECIKYENNGKPFDNAGNTVFNYTSSSVGGLASAVAPAERLTSLLIYNDSSATLRAGSRIRLYGVKA